MGTDLYISGVNHLCKSRYVMGDLERSLLDALYQTILADKDDVARCTALIFLEEHGLHVLAR